MIIGVPKEIKDHESRVSVTPDGVRTLCAGGHALWVESSAGNASGFTDEEYRKAGAHIAASPEEVFQEAELIVKVKEPQASEYKFFRQGQTLFTFLHLAASVELTRALMDAGITAIAYETTESDDHSFPMLSPMSEIAGRMSVQIGAHYLEKSQGGRGVLLSGVPGVAPAHVVVLGAGVVGAAAVRIAVGMCAQVSVFNLDLQRLQYLDDLYRGRVVTHAPHQTWIDQEVEQADLVVGAVMIPGARAPRIVSRTVVSRMRPGSVIVDVSVDQGGCIETTRPTTHSEPVYFLDGVLHYGVPNMPGIVPHTSTLALTNATLPFIVHLASAGIAEAIRSHGALRQGVNVIGGKIACRGVAEAHGLRYQPLT
ncbi:MAG TPA: alanine dehydrogenase [Nitrospiraceae bacterium]|nr:alanine dehydrogenase [Nitrospiraceae bacterium]